MCIKRFNIRYYTKTRMLKVIILFSRAADVSACDSYQVDRVLWSPPLPVLAKGAGLPDRVSNLPIVKIINIHESNDNP